MNKNLVPSYYSSLAQLIDTQKILVTILSSYQLEHLKTVGQFSEPFKILKERLASQSHINTKFITQSINEPFRAINQSLKNTYNNEIIKLLKQSQLLLSNEVAKLNMLHEPLNSVDSLKASDIYSSIVNEASQENLLDDSDIKLVNIEETDKKSLTLEQIIAIITVIIAIISTVLTQLPNKQATEIIDSLNQLIEIESKQLELLKQIDDNLSD